MDNDFSSIKNLININKTLVKLVKFIIFSVSIYYVSLVFYENFKQIKVLARTKIYKIIGFVLFSSILYSFLLLILAKAWKKILELIEKKTYAYQVNLIYLISILYKYLPGNIFHYANRHVAASKLGVKHKTLLKSNVVEALGLIFSALIFSVFIFHLWKVNWNIYMPIIALAILLLYTLRNQYLVYLILKVTPYYLFYFLSIGLLCFYVVHNLTGNQLSVLLCISLYSISWIAGYIIPGAPGGIGVRESIFVLLSHNLINPAEAIFIISILRLSTTLGEVFSYIYAKSNFHYHLHDTSGS